MYTLPTFMNEVLSEERQLMKWVGIFPGEFSYLNKLEICNSNFQMVIQTKLYQA